MNFTPRSIRWSCFVSLTLPLALAGFGCGGDTPSAAPGDPARTAVHLPTGGSNDDVQYLTPGPDSPGALNQDAAARPPLPAQSRVSRDGGSDEQAAVIAPPERAAVRDRARLDAAAATVQHNVEQTSTAVAQQAGEFQAGVTRAVGDVQAEAKQTATNAAADVKGFAAELRDDAAQTFHDAVGEVKAGMTGVATDARGSVRGAADSARGQVRSAVDGAKGNVRSAVEDAKETARRKAKAAGVEVRKSAQGLKDDVLNGLLGPTPKK